MATKKNKTVQNNAKLFGMVYYKFVKKAQLWCKTSFDENGKQKQEWSNGRN